MFRYSHDTDIFASSDQALVNPVTCNSEATSGLSLDFARRFPAMFARYRQRSSQRRVRLGEPWLDRGQLPWIINFPTRRDHRDRPPIYAIWHGLLALQVICRQAKISSLSVPALGCDGPPAAGRLAWDRVRTLLEDLGSTTPFLLTIYPPAPLDWSRLGQADRALTAEPHSEPRFRHVAALI